MSRTHSSVVAEGRTVFLTRLSELGVTADVRTMSDTTHTAADAAAAVGCGVEQIVKSLLFIADDVPLLVLVSGPNRVDVALLGAILGQSVQMANAKFVKQVTGYSIGGVPPLGFPQPIRTVIDRDLLVLDEVWAAAGTANDVFAIEPWRLVELTGARAVQVHT